MKQFKFSAHTPAKVAKPAKECVNKETTFANNLLKSAKVKGLPLTLANLSKTLAKEEASKIKRLSNLDFRG